MNDYQNGDILYHCIDHLPSELPYESSIHFGEKLLPFLIDVANSDINKPFDQQIDDYAKEIKGAIITSNGKLTPKYEYIKHLRIHNEKEKEDEIVEK